MLYYCTYGGLSTYTYVYTLYVYRLFSRETLLTTFGALEAETRSGDGAGAAGSWSICYGGAQRGR